MIDAVKLFDYNVWANRRIAEQIKELSDEQLSREVGGSFPSIKLTLLHLQEADSIWMHRWKGIPIVQVPADWSTANTHFIIDRWLTIQNETQAIVKGFAPRQSEEIAFTTKKGVPFIMPFLDTLIHVTNHGTYHRGQIVNMLRMLGEQAVSTDYFIFCTVALK